MRKKPLITCVTFIILIFCLVWGVRYFNDRSINQSEAAIIAKDYFYDKYQWDVDISEIEYRPVSEKDSLYFIHLDYEGQTYQCYVKKNGSVVGDDVVQVNIVSSFSDDGIRKALEQIEGIESIGVASSLNYWSPTHKVQNVTAKVVLNELPLPEHARSYFETLVDLKAQQVDHLNIVVNSPALLDPNSDLGHGSHGVQFGSFAVVTNEDETLFHKRYREFCGEFYLNEPALADVVQKIQEIGGENTYCYVDSATKHKGYGLIIYSQANDEKMKQEIEAIELGDPEEYLKVRDIPVELITQVDLKV